MTTVNDQPPATYIPRGPLASSPGGGFQPPEVRRQALYTILAGVELGLYDAEIVGWIAGALDDSTARTLGSLMWRARLAGRAEVTALTDDQARAVDRARGILAASECGVEVLAETVGADDGDSPSVSWALVSCLGRLVEVVDELTGGGR